MENQQSTSCLSCQNSQRVKFTVSVDALHVQKQCRLPKHANVSILFQVDSCKKITKNYPCQPNNDRDCHACLKDNFTFDCTMDPNTLPGEYKAKLCKVVLLTRYEMYGKHGYKSLARAAIPLHDLLSSLVSSAVPQVRRIEFDNLEGISVDTSWSAQIEDDAKEGETKQSTICDLPRDFELMVSPATSGSFIVRAGTSTPEDEPEVNHKAANVTEDTPESHAIQIPLSDRAETIQTAPPHHSITTTVTHQATQTTVLTDDNNVDEQIAAYLELAVENDDLVRSLITVKMEHAVLANEVDALRKYNYTLEQRLLRFYRKSNDIL